MRLLSSVSQLADFVNYFDLVGLASKCARISLLDQKKGALRKTPFFLENGLKVRSRTWPPAGSAVWGYWASH